MLTKLKKMILSLLCISMVITMIQPKIIVATEPEEVIVTEDDSIQNESVIKYEDLTLREESSKTYVMSDGSYQKVMYSIPVHYEENDEWNEIDNTLTEDEVATISDDEVNGYENNKAKQKIKFSKKTHKSNLASVQLDQYKIKWGIDTDYKSEAKIIRNNEIIEDERLKVFKNINQNIIYENIYDHIDLEYSFDSNTIKENIILKEKANINEFTFNYKVDNLVLTLNDNQIEARDESSDELVFTMPQPYMVDANGEVSYDVTYELNQKNKKYEITIIADEEWLNDEDRTYPVVIDPVIITERNRVSVDTTFISSSQPTTNHTNKAEMIVGNESSEYGTCRTLVRIALPELQRGDMIVDAQLVLTSHARNFYSSSTPDLQINAHMITSSWTYNSVTWNTRPSYEDATVLDFDLIKRSDNNEENGVAEKYFNITNAVKQWYAGTKTNHGIVIKPNYETTSDYASYGVKGELWSERRTNTTSPFYPFIALTYRNNKGIESYWDFVNATTSDGDTIAVNTYSGNPVIIHEDASTDSASLPVTVSHIFNGYQANAQFDSVKPNTGKGWKLNIQQKIRYSEKYGLTGVMLTEFPYVYIDEDGTEHFFKQTENGLIDEDGLGLTLTVDASNEAARFTIEDKSKNKLIFHRNGNLQKIIKENGNTITYTYGSGSLDHHIEKITDASGQSISFKYENLMLTEIIDQNEKVTKYSYENGYLMTITDPYGKTTEFEYDTDGAITKVIAKDGSSIVLQYTTLASGKQVNHLEERAGDSNGSLGQTLRFSRNEYNITDVISSGIDNIRYNSDDIVTKYEFDNAGRLTTVYGYTNNGKELGATSVAFTSSAPKTNDSDIKKLNRLTKIADLSPTIINLLTNHSGESTSGWVSGNSASSVSATYSSSAEQYLFGTKSFKINVTSSSNNLRSRFIQDHDEDIIASKTYTFSAYVKTNNINVVDSNAGGGAMLLVAIKSSSGWKDAISEYITGTTDTAINDGWRRISVTFTAPSDIEYIRTMMVVMNATGTAYFDGVQLEEGNVANSYNMIENPSFEKITNNFGDSWSKYNLTTDDKTSTSAVKYGTYSVRMHGNGKASKEITQTIKINGSEQDTYVLSGWLYGKIIESNANDEARRADITVMVTYSDNSTVKKTVVNYNPTVSNWKYGAGSFNLSDGTNDTKIPVSLTICLRSYHQGNKLYFDGIQLIKKDVDIFSYDDNGNLKSDGSKNYTYDNHRINTKFDGIDTTFSYEYDSKGNVEKVTNDINSVIKEYGYDNFNNPTYSIIKNTATGDEILTQDIYDEDGINLIMKEDADGYITEYDYEKGKLKSVTDALENTLSYTYVNDLIDTLTKGSVILDLNYDAKQRLTEIKMNDRSYGYVYDVFGNLIKTKAGENEVSENTYQQTNGNLSSVELKNGITTSYTYDEYGNIVEVKENTSLLTANKYDKEGRLISTTDHKANRITIFDYDFKDRIIRTSVFDSSRTELEDGFVYGYEYGYDEYDRIVKRNYTINNQTVSNNIIYKEGSYINSYSIDNYKKITYDYDGLNRVSSKTINTSTPIEINYTFAGSARETNYTTSKIETETIGEVLYTYQYDRLGNITQIKRGSQTIQYKYDQYSRLVRENNQILNKSIEYEYDGNGNILSKKEYAYTTGTLSNSTNIINYSYVSNTDRLSNYNGQTIGEYDQIGNPGIYRGYDLEWVGRKLTSIKQGNNVLYSYSYDAGGTRLSKTVGSTTTKYTTVDGKVIQEERGNTTLIYSYDNNGHLAKITHKTGSTTTDYYVVCNSRGDSEAIYNSSGAVIARYSYDSWGKVVSVTNANGNAITDTSHIANLNPIRYRGYYYDTETGYYYLGSRYYDPEVGRFISADDISVVSIDTASFCDKNLYSYCDNNPINRCDSEGNFWETAFDIATLLASINDVKNNPKDPLAWAGLAGDALDLLPFVTGIGEITKAFKAVDKIADNAATVADMKKKLIKIKDAASNLNKGVNTVYVSYLKNGLIEYVGITNDFERRKKEWEGIRKIVPYIENLDRDAARYVEQAVIDTFGFATNGRGGYLNNFINSIGRRNPKYAGYIDFFTGIFK